MGILFLLTGLSGVVLFRYNRSLKKDKNISYEKYSDRLVNFALIIVVSTLVVSLLLNTH